MTGPSSVSYADDSTEVVRLGSEVLAGYVCSAVKSTHGAADFGSLVQHAEDAPPPNPAASLDTDGVEFALFLDSVPPHPPDWAPFLASGFPDATLVLPPQSSAGGLLFVRLTIHDKKRIFAFTFGTGRYLLRSDLCERRFGLKVALNAIFEGDMASSALDSATRLKSVESKRVAANTIRSRQQSTRAADLEQFDIDRDRDFMRGVTGKPANTATWGRNISGSDLAVTVRTPLKFSDIPDACRRVAGVASSGFYKRRFSWIDDISPVSDKGLAADLEEIVVGKLRQEDLANLDLTVPEVIEWDRAYRFVLPHERRRRNNVTSYEPELADYVRGLGHERREALTIQALRSQHLDIEDETGARQYRWSAWSCLTAELDVDGKTYILDEGEFYEVSADYIQQLDRAIDTLVPASTLTLPSADLRDHEGDYNAEAAKQSMLLLDKRLVSIASSTSSIEICDLLTPARQFVHVKRKLGSSQLSHLFAQGYVSADLLQNSKPYQDETVAMVRKALKERPAACAKLTMADFTWIQRQILPSDIEVVFAIIAPWKGRSLGEALPFFSKVNLRRHAQDLRSRGFQVGHVPVVGTLAT